MTRIGLGERAWWGLLLTGLGCSPFHAYEPPPRNEQAKYDVDAGSQCPHARLPQRPSPSRPDPDEEQLEIAFAVREVDIGEFDDEHGVPKYLSMGFDLDETCTGQGEGQSCVLPQGTEELMDNADGRDNGLGPLFHMARLQLGRQWTGPINTHAANGNITMLVRVRGYNGKTDDDEVRVAVYIGTRMNSVDPEAVADRPRWDGQDVWRVLDLFIDHDAPVDPRDPQPAAKYEDAHGFVVDGQLLARFPTVLISTGFLNGAFLTARLVPDEELGSFKLVDGQMGGRLHIDQLLWAYERIVISDRGAKVRCMDELDYEFSKSVRCALADINNDLIDDGTGLCDAVSWAWRFDASAAELGAEQTHELAIFQPDRSCPPELSPRLNDHCADPN